MKNKYYRLIALLVTIIILASVPVQAAGAQNTKSSKEQDIRTQVSDRMALTASYLQKTVQEPAVGSIGGEWAVIALTQGVGADKLKQGWVDGYVKRAEDFLRESGGILSTRKYTEYSRVILAMTACGRDPSNIAGYDLVSYLGDYSSVLLQGINGPVWALIALDSGNYYIPECSGAAVQATRQKYIDEILSRQLDCGGWDLSGRGGSGEADADLTAMVLQALAGYTDQTGVKTGVDKAIKWLSSVQLGDGGFSSGGAANSESTAQVIIAMCALDIGLDDGRFSKNGKTPYDALMSYALDDGSFRHLKDGSSNAVATEQAACALAALTKYYEGKGSLYSMHSETAENAEAAERLLRKMTTTMTLSWVMLLSAM